MKYQKLYSDTQDDLPTKSETIRLQEQRLKLALLRKDEQIEQEASTSQLYKSLSFQVTAVTIILGVLTLFYLGITVEKSKKRSLHQVN